MKARMLVPYGRYEVGEIVLGSTAKMLVDEGFAVEVKPKKKAKSGAPENKSAGKSPETKKA